MMMNHRRKGSWRKSGGEEGREGRSESCEDKGKEKKKKRQSKKVPHSNGGEKRVGRGIRVSIQWRTERTEVIIVDRRGEKDDGDGGNNRPH
jgi:hypothetical protein